MKNQTIQIRITEDLKNRLKTLSDKTGVPMSKLIVSAVEGKVRVEEYILNSNDEHYEFPEFIPPQNNSEIDDLRDEIESMKEKIDLIYEAIKTSK